VDTSQPPPLPQVTVSLPGRPVWAELLAVTLSLAVMAGAVLAMMPAHDRQMMVAALRQQKSRLYRGLSARAHRAGYEGMTSELAGRNPGVWYDRARGLAWWRDRVRP